MRNFRLMCEVVGVLLLAVAIYIATAKWLEANELREQQHELREEFIESSQKIKWMNDFLDQRERELNERERAFLLRRH